MTFTPAKADSPHRYLAFGLCLSLPFAIDQLPHAPDDIPPDIRVIVGETPATLPHLFQGGRNEFMQAYVEMDSQGNMLWTTDRARFWIYEGSTIVVQLLAALKVETQSHFILSTCIPTLLNQRGLLAIHANAVVGPQGAIAISGHSGAGKSTMLAALMARGLPMLADDVTVLQKGAGAHPDVLPGYRSYRLCADTLEQIEPIAARLVDVGGIRRKFLLIAPEEKMHPTPVPLHSFFVLRLYDGDALHIRRVDGMQAFQLVQENCYHPAGMLRSPTAFEQINQVARECSVYEILRPANRWTTDEIIEFVLAPLNEQLSTQKKI